MKEEKSFWRKLNAWINGEEALIHADEYIARREQPKKRQWLKRPNMQEIKSNKGLYWFLCVLISIVFITIMLLVVYPLNKKKVEENSQVLRERRAGK